MRYAWFVVLVPMLVLCAYMRPPLTGQGCEGASGPLYAYEESDFPRCEIITRG